MTHTLETVRALDRHDPLAALREQFDLPPGLVYLDGNSLGALPRRTTKRVRELVELQPVQSDAQLLAHFADQGLVVALTRLPLAAW